MVWCEYADCPVFKVGLFLVKLNWIEYLHLLKTVKVKHCAILYTATEPFILLNVFREGRSD